jgi:hypothetical protein
VRGFESSEGVLTLQDPFQVGLEILGRRRVPDEPIDLRAVAAEDERRRCRADRESREGLSADGRVTVGQEENEILVEKGMELGVVVELLTQQSAACSAAAIKIDDNELVFALGLGDRLLQGPLEPILGRCGGGENEDTRKNERFFHDVLLPLS